MKHAAPLLCLLAAVTACGASPPEADEVCRPGLRAELVEILLTVDEVEGLGPLVATTDAVIDGAPERVAIDGEVELHAAAAHIRREGDEIDVPLSLCPFGSDDFQEAREVERTTDHALDELGLGPLRAHARCRYVVTLEECGRP